MGGWVPPPPKCIFVIFVTNRAATTAAVEFSSTTENNLHTTLSVPCNWGEPWVWFEIWSVVWCLDYCHYFAIVKIDLTEKLTKSFFQCIPIGLRFKSPLQDFFLDCLLWYCIYTCWPRSNQYETIVINFGLTDMKEGSVMGIAREYQWYKGLTDYSG